MGRVNAVRTALAGYPATLYDVDPRCLEAAPAQLEESAELLVAGGQCSAADIPAALARLSVEPDLARAVDGVDLVSESVYERLDIKREVHSQLDALCAPQTIVTTNSSFLLPSEIEAGLSHGERFAALHSYMASPLMDIVGCSRTKPSVIDTLRDYAASLGAIPLVLNREYPGYLLNAMLGPVLATAKLLLLEGRGSCEEIDRSWMRRRQAPAGPFGILDLIGLGLVHDSWQHREDEGPIPGLRPRVLSLLEPYVRRGDLGVRSGRGFYCYPDAPYMAPGFAAGGPQREDLYRPLELALLGSALAIAGSNVAEPADIDLAWRIGMSLDAGPFELFAELGRARFAARFSQHVGAGCFDPGRADVALQYLGRGSAEAPA